MNEKGFTLIELILVVVLLGIIAVAMTSAFVPTVTVSVNVDQRKEAFQQGRTAMERMMREVREARTITTITAPPGATSMTFARGSNPNQPVRYSWSGVALDPLQRSRDDQACPPCTMVEIACCIQSLTMTYLTKAGAATTTPASVWEIQADLQVLVGGQTIQLRSEAHPRGLF